MKCCMDPFNSIDSFDVEKLTLLQLRLAQSWESYQIRVIKTG